MNLAQSSHVPGKGRPLGLTDFPWLVAYALRGLVELVRARAIFSRLDAKDIIARNRRSKAKAIRQQHVTEKTLARIAYVLPRISDRVPWRSDCLIQAIAGQNWLLSAGAKSEIQIGVENPKDGEFGAHAWLVHEDQVVTGGNIERYHLLLADSRLSADSED